MKKHLAPYMDDTYADYLENSNKIKANIKSMNIVDLLAGERQFSSSAATNPAAFLDSALAQGTHATFPGTGDGSMSGFVNPSTSLTSQGYRSLTVDFGRYSPQELEILTVLKNSREIPIGKVIINQDEENEEELNADQ